MWNGQTIELRDWSDFAPTLALKLKSLGHIGQVAVRNFLLETHDLDEDDCVIRSVDRLALVEATGTDRDEHSPMWSAVGHDYDHDGTPSGKSPPEILYAYVAEIIGDGYLVHYQGRPENMDLTKSLTDNDGILIYDAAQLNRVTKNEHWFRANPVDALLLVFILA